MKNKKLYLTSTGQEVTYGDKIRSEINQDDIVSTCVITISDVTIPMLMKLGALVETPTETTITISNIIESIANKLNWKPQKVEGFLNTLNALMPMAAFNLVLREIAIMLDQKYPDHINKSERIYCISTLDGRIHEVCKKHIKNYRNFAAFRTIEDAKIACNILRTQLKDMFTGGAYK